jgi:hypothetical protein
VADHDLTAVRRTLFADLIVVGDVAGDGDVVGDGDEIEKSLT